MRAAAIFNSCTIIDCTTSYYDHTMCIYIYICMYIYIYIYIHTISQCH